MKSLKNRRVGRAWQAFQRIWTQPATLLTVLREACRTSMGIPFDRAWRDGRSGMPAVLNFELTRRCNLRCLMCPQLRHVTAISPELGWYDAAQDLPLDAWVRVLDQAVAFKPRLYITGGEPLLYPAFDALVIEAKRRHLFVEVQTNGTRLAKVADLLVECGVNVVTVSLDGPPAVHDEIRGVAGAFERLREGVEAIHEASRRRGKLRPLLRGTCMITRRNLAVLDDCVATIASLGFDCARCEHPIIDTPENTARHNAMFTPEFAAAQGLPMVAPSVMEGEYYQNELAAEDLPLLREKLRQAREKAGDLPLVVLPELSDTAMHAYYFDMNFPFAQTCNALWKVCKIASDGSVLPCLHLIMGNVTQQSLADIWNGRPMVNFRRLVSRGLFPGCARCCRRSFSVDQRQMAVSGRTSPEHR
ncbi:MAG: radical SAM protein [Verrucomicrobia bacterium]|nr:radical SAM protein [Verrucomicrobiota bacterium]